MSENLKFDHNNDSKERQDNNEVTTSKQINENIEKLITIDGTEDSGRMKNLTSIFSRIVSILFPIYLIAVFINTFFVGICRMNDGNINLWSYTFVPAKGEYYEPFVEKYIFTSRSISLLILILIITLGYYAYQENRISKSSYRVICIFSLLAFVASIFSCSISMLLYFAGGG